MGVRPAVMRLVSLLCLVLLGYRLVACLLCGQQRYCNRTATGLVHASTQ